MKKLVCLVIIGLLLGLLAPVVYAQDDGPQSVPNGPWVTPNQTRQLQRFITIDELTKALQNSEAQSKGRMKLEIATYSNQGRPVYVAKFGQPDAKKTAILIESSIHGDEQIHVVSMVNLIQTLATSGNKDVLDILDKLTIWIVPMMNPDGNMTEKDGLWYPTRENVQTWKPEDFGLPADTPAPFYYNANVPGMNMNRDFNPNLNYVLSMATNVRPNTVGNYRGRSSEPGFEVAPETRAMVALFKALRPKLFIDLHMQYPTYAQSTTDNGMNTLQLLGVVLTKSSYTDRDNNVYTLDPAVIALSKQVNSLVYQKLTANGNSLQTNITKYAPINYPGSSLGAFELNGAAIMLFEGRGGSIYDNGQKGSGVLIQQMYNGVYETLKAFVSGEVYTIDPTFYDTVIPNSGPRIDNPHDDGD
jgi:hypothetical protein